MKRSGQSFWSRRSDSLNPLSKLSARLKKAFATKRNRRRSSRAELRSVLGCESLELRRLMATITATNSGNWTDPATWQGGVVPTANDRAIIGQNRTVTLNGLNTNVRELVVHGTLTVAEGAAGSATRSLTTRWIHVNSNGVFRIGSAADRYDNNDFVLTLTGTDRTADFSIEMASGMMMPITDNDGFLMTGMGGSVQFFGDEKLSFTKLSQTAFRNSTTITVENVIERNFDGTTSAASDGSLVGALAWEVGDEIVIASSSYDYTEQDVRTITGVNVQGSRTVLTLNQPLSYRHYGAIESYKNGELSIDLRAEVALLNRSIRIQGTQDTDSNFGNRARYGTSAGRNLGIGAHAMFMTNSGPIILDSTQFDRMGQTGTVGRYPIHWHLGGNRTGDVMRNSSVTNSNNRGVIVHGTQGLLIEGNVLHDIHGHGIFLEDGAEFNNQFLSNIVLGIHRVGGGNVNDPFIVPGVTRGSNGRVNGDAPRNGNGESSHDTGQQVSTRFLASAAYWITNPSNTFVGNISAGSEGTGFWFILPDRVIGLSRDTGLYNNLNPSTATLGRFDNNTSHSSPIGLTFDRGSDIRGGGAVGYTPNVRATFNDFTGYKHDGTAVYHRGNNVTFDGSMFADVRSGSFNTFQQIERNILFVGHSRGNATLTAEVGGYKLYDGPGEIIGAHFAGFAEPNAYTFVNTGGAQKHAMTRASGITFEDDGTTGHISVGIVQDFVNKSPVNAAGRPDALSGIVLDVDGSLTGPFGGGPGHVLTPRIDFYRDSTDITPAGWDAYISDDRFGYLRLDTITGNGNFPFFNVFNGDGHRFIVNRRNITEQRLYTKLNAGDYTFVFTEPVPSDGFRFTMRVMRGSEPGDFSIYNFTGVGTNYRPTSGIETTSLTALRASTSNAFFRDGNGDLWMKVFQSGSTIDVRPTNAPLPTTPEVSGLVLVNANDDEDISALTDGMVLNLTALPSRDLNVRAATNSTTGSVQFVLTGPSPYTVTESLAPYALFGDNDGDFNSEPLLPGAYTLVVTPYTGAGLTGTAGAAVTVNFTIIEPVQLPFLDQTVQNGTIILAEEFDAGGQGVAYFDTSTGNSGSGNNARRNEDVDLNGASILVGNVVDGEWLEFTRDIVPGVYDINVNVNPFSLQNPPKGIRLLIADNVFSTSFTELGSVVIPDASTVGTSFAITDVDLTQWGGSGRVFRVEFFAADRDIVVTPVGAVLAGASPTSSTTGWYLDYGANGQNWFNGSGLSDTTINETGVLVPTTWPVHLAGNNSGRVARIRNAPEQSTLTFDLGGRYDISGMALWNSTEPNQTQRGFENTRLSYSTDGVNFTGSDLLTWSRLTDTTNPFGPEVQSLPEIVEGITHIRMVVDNFSPAGADRIVMASELRFIGKGNPAVGSNLTLNFDTLSFSSVATESTVVSRGIAYRGAGTSYGTDAIDTTKSALHGPGAIASMSNFTNYLHGINRVVIDIDEMSANDLTAADFQFRVGNTNNFANAQEWTAAVAPAINVQALSATTRRVTLDWPDGTITNQWLEVTVRANANTNLAQDDVFYFGNQIGDVNGSVSSSGRVTVNSFDSLDIRRNQSAGQNSVGIGNLFDVDRNGSVNSFDTLAVRRNQVAGGGLLMITLPGAIANLSAATSASPPAAASLSASPLQNPSNPLDVNGDGAVTALDALIGINFMGRSNAESESFGFAGSSTSSMFYDVNGDGIVTARDSLQVINGLSQTRVAPAASIVAPLVHSSTDRDDELGWVSNDAVRLDLAHDLALMDDWSR